MNKEKLNKLQEVINDQLDLIEMNVSRINNKDYFGLDFELLKYIRNLENQLDIANNKNEQLKNHIEESLNYFLKEEDGVLEIKYVKEKYLKPLLIAIFQLFI